MDTNRIQTNIHFTVITTTYKRPEAVLKSIHSVLNQTNPNWQLCIVIDDVSSDYSEMLALCKNNAKITTLHNENNSGKNYSLNRVLDVLTEQKYSGYIIYLDDDDWLHENCFADFTKAITSYNGPVWLVSERTNALTNIPFTKVKKNMAYFYYPKDVLLLKNFTGDVTHCVQFPQTVNCRFPTNIKNAEEWMYFSQVSKIATFIFLEKTGTYSAGYAPLGLTKNRINDFKNYRNVLSAALQYRLFSIYIVMYLLGRLIKMVVQTLLWNLNKIRS
jgi:glycosyltransferase involved in cell wall biosynthesis